MFKANELHVRAEPGEQRDSTRSHIQQRNWREDPTSFASPKSPLMPVGQTPYLENDQGHHENLPPPHHCRVYRCFLLHVL